MRCYEDEEPWGPTTGCEDNINAVRRMVRRLWAEQAVIMKGYEDERL